MPASLRLKPPRGGKEIALKFARLMEGATELKCSQFAAALVENM